MTRRMALEGIDNFRDYGGYPARAGKRLRRGRLFRSAGHGRATDSDLDAVAALGLAVVVDLRRPDERRRDPSRRPAGFAGQVIESDLGEDEEDAWWAHMRSADLSVETFHAYMLNYYRDAPHHPRHIDLYARYFRALAEHDGPVLIHCAAGKDRTGILAALTHHLTGVHRDDMIADYLATNDPATLDRRLPLVSDAIATTTGRRPPDSVVRIAMSVEAAYLEAAFATMCAENGDLDGYLRDVLRVDDALREALHDRLLE